MSAAIDPVTAGSAPAGSGTTGPGAPPQLHVDVDALRRRRSVKWSAVAPDVIASWVAEMDFAVAEPVRCAVLEAVAREDFGYPPHDADSGLPEAFAAYAERAWGWVTDPGHVGLVPDVVRGAELALEVFSPPGTAVLVPVPSYPPFFDLVARRAGRAVRTTGFAEQDGRPVLDLEAVAAELAGGARTVLLCNPYNPLGRVFTRAELGALAEVVERFGARVISDEIHAPLVMPGHHHVPYATVSDVAAAHSVTVTSASKAWNLAGLKCAQVATHSDREADAWRALPDIARDGTSTLGIAAQIAAYTEGTPWLTAVLAQIDRNRHRLAELLAEHLPGTGYRPPEGTYLAWLDCRGLELPDPAGHFLDKARVALADGRTFGPPGAGFVRLNLATSPELLAETVRRMGASVRGTSG